MRFSPRRTAVARRGCLDLIAPLELANEELRVGVHLQARLSPMSLHVPAPPAAAGILGDIVSLGFTDPAVKPLDHGARPVGKEH